MLPGWVDFTLSVADSHVPCCQHFQVIPGIICIHVYIYITYCIQYYLIKYTYVYIYKSIYVEPAEVCEKAVQWISAVALFHLCHLEVTPDVITYNAVLSACQKSAQWQRALDLFGEVQDQRIQPTIITCHLDGMTEIEGILTETELEFTVMARVIPVIRTRNTRFMECISPCVECIIPLK